MSINSEEYWDKRFETDWENNGGRKQTQYFTELAIKSIPKPIINLFNENLTFLDWGCAEGDGTNIFSERFPKLKVYGLDFSSSAIKKATEHFPNIPFYSGSLKDSNQNYDIIFTSNCLEHYTNPYEWVHQLMEYTKKVVIIMVPFQEYNRIDEHFYTFDYHSFPLKLNSFIMTYFRVLDSNPEYWPGKQLLIIYSKQDSEIINNLNIELYDPNESLELYEQDNYIEKLKKQILERDEACNSLIKENKALSEWVSVLQKEVRKREESVSSLKNELLEKDKWINNLKDEINKRDEAARYLKTEIEEKDKWINNLKDEINKRDEATHYLKTEIAEKDKWITILQEEVAKRDKSIQDLVKEQGE